MKSLKRISLLALIVFIGCDTSKETNESPNNGPTLFSYEIVKLKRTEPTCESPCAEVTINYPVFIKGPGVHEIYNEVITAHLKEITSGFAMDQVAADQPLDELIRLFFNGFKKVKSEFPETSSEWYLKVDVVVSYSTEELVSLALNTTSYTGGAYPNREVQYINLTREGKKLTSPGYFVDDINKLKSLAERKFRKQTNLEASADLAESGYIFDNNEFQLTDNFGLTRAGLVFYYNNYEIASYAEGPTAIIIPFEEVSALSTRDQL